MDVNIVQEDKEKGKDYSKIDNGDVVIFPAFGVGANDMKLFRDKGVNIVDTTCPWVAKVSALSDPDAVHGPASFPGRLCKCTGSWLAFQTYGHLYNELRHITGARAAYPARVTCTYLV